MRVFVTGATGFIGSVTVRELLQAGHQVLGLARSDAAAAALAAAGAEVQRGTLDDLDSLRKGVAAADGVIHLAYNHDFSQYEAAARSELRAIETLGEALGGSGRPLVIASGLLGLAVGRVATERDLPDAATAAASPRSAGARAALAFAERGVRSSIVRLAPLVHGEVKRGFVGTLIDIARQKGVSGTVGDGSNRWPAGHTLDAARLYRLALEAAPARSRLHAVGDEGIPFRQIAEVIGRQLDLPVRSVAADEADAYFGFMALFVMLDNPTSSALTQELLDWHPTHPGLIDDLDQGHYFDDPAGT